jgi:tetratricopeptide (TPR) repeat protein
VQAIATTLEPKRPRRPAGLLVVVAGALALIGAVVLILHMRARGSRAGTAEQLPATPALETWPAEARERIARCEERIRRGRDPLLAWAELSRLYHANGFFREARDCYRALIELEPKNPRWAHCRAVILADYGQLDEAVPLFKRALGNEPTHGPTAIHLGNVLFKLGQVAEAARAFEGVVQREPANVFAVAGLARIDIAAGAWARARDQLAAVAEKTRYGTALDLLATAYDRLDQPEHATRIRTRIALTKVFREMPDPWVDELAADCFDPYMLSVAAAAADNFGDAPAAIRWLERAISFAATDASLHRQLGQILLSRREFTGARRHCETAARLAPEEADNWVHLIRTLAAVGDAAALDRTLGEALAACPNSPALHLENGRRFRAKGDYPAALREFAESSRLRPHEADAFIESAHIHFRLNHPAEAIEQLRHALVAVPGHPVATYFLAQHAIETGDAATALRLIEQAQQQPKFRPDELAALRSAYRERFGQSP